MAAVRKLAPGEVPEALPSLADILVDCVMGGAGVSFQPPLSPERAEAFWRKVAASVAAHETILLVAEQGDQIVGTVQVQLTMIENQPHRAEIAKMLVRTSARRRGIGAALMQAAEVAARDAGRTLLTLDTVTDSSGERLYASLGWFRVGVIPGYALTPYDGLKGTTIFYKQIG
jgi:GNAT superfamily N-acetyltransferase